MTNNNNYLPKLTLKIEDNPIKISLPFTIKWNNQEYHGKFIITSSKNGIENWGIKWLKEKPNFGEFETYIYEELEENLFKELSKRCKIL
jgi:hypothetical protein